METFTAEDELMPFREVAQALGNSQSWVCRLTQQGRLPYVTTPLGRLYVREGVERFINDRKAKATTHE